MNSHNFILTTVKMNALIIILTMVFSTGSFAQVNKSVQSKNDRISNAASPFEDLTEYALAENKEGVNKSLSSCKSEILKVKDLLSSETFNKIETLISEMEGSDLMKQSSDIALKSVEGYHLLILSLDPKTSVVPVQVSLLDYVGFKSTALLSAKKINWNEVLSTAKEGEKLWSEISHSVKNKGLNDAVVVAVKGMEEAAIEKNIGKAKLAAQIDLALVDLLEKYFDIKK